MAKRKKISKIILLLLIFLVCVYFDIFAGYKDFGLSLASKVFSFKPINATDSLILDVLRFPRVIKAIIAGSSLALAGFFMQSVTKNPLAEPYITGISSGAGLGIVLSIVFLNGVNYSLFGFLGAMLSSVLVISFAGFNRFSITKLVLIGLSVNVFVSSLISLIVLSFPNKSYIMMLILSGGFNNSDLISNKLLLSIYSIALLAACFMVPKLNFLQLDDNLVVSSRNIKKMYTYLVIILSAFLASLSVLSAGILGFLGIIAPQIAAILVGKDARYLFLASALIGASVLLISDYISRVAIYPLQMPLGLVIAFIGAPIFVYFLTAKRGLFDD